MILFSTLGKLKTATTAIANTACVVCVPISLTAELVAIVCVFLLFLDTVLTLLLMCSAWSLINRTTLN